ncbi:MAG: T9SS type A sorting domain-containing protein [Lewinellaceae bacterium]|nr:T9SS type A sorting domain-containing protein [Lewinellaceae bacterium]
MFDLGKGGASGEEVEFDTKLKLYRHLNRLQDITTLDEDLDSLYVSMSSTDFAKFIEFEDIYNEAVKFSENEAAQKDQLSLDMEALRGEMAAIEWYVVDTVAGEGNLIPSEKAAYDGKRALLRQKVDDLATLVAAKQSALNSVLGNLATVNNSIGAQATMSGQNLQAVNGLLIQRYSPDFTGFSESDVTLLTEIAEQCVGQGGEGVYIARALLAEQLMESVEYADECIEELTERGSRANGAEATAPSALKIMPNPADDMARVALPHGHNIAHLSLMDAYGQTVQVFEVRPGQTSLNMDTGRMNPGIYFLVPSDKEEVPVRFIIAH